jgi:uncharacterized membrane protein YjjP (DUF1212 family)
LMGRVDSLSIKPEKESFVVELARALHESGAPAHRLEEAIADACTVLHIKVACFSTPTSLFLDFGNHTRLLRVEPREIHLERLVLIDGLVQQLSHQKLSMDAALEQIRLLEALPPRYGPLVTIGAFGVVSGCTAVFFGLDWLGAGVAMGLGLIAGLIGVLLEQKAQTARIVPLLTALVVAAAATWLGRQLPFSIPGVTLAGIIVLIPGLTVVIALNELATRHLGSGTARLAGAGVLFLQLGLGCALGWRLSFFLPHSLKAENLPMPEWANLLALLLAGAGYTVLFRARPRDSGVVGGMGAIAFYTARITSASLGPELGAALGGLVVGLLGNAQARLRNVPAAVGQLPGLLLLVPGSLGFRGLGALIQDDIDTGISLSFSMILVAAGLVAGMLTAGVLLSPQRSL